MTFTTRLLATLFALLLTATTAGAATPLVDTAWLRANIKDPNVVVLDVRSHPREVFARGHIPGAIYTDYAKDGWREKNAAGIEGMLPPPEKLEALLGRLGIGNDTLVVIVPEGRTAQDMGTATRIYWTLKVLGHDAVSILDGGFMAYVSEVDAAKKPVNPIESGDVTPKPRTFKASLRTDMLVPLEAAKKAVADKTTLVDYRPYDFYVGLTKSGAAKKAGTIPGAKSLPEGWLTENGGGKFRSLAQLKRIYQAAGVPETGPQVSFCNTGHWASLGWFVAHELLGNKDVKMFDGSMAEWTADASLPVQQGIKLD